MRHVFSVFVATFSRLQRHILRSAHKKKIEVHHATRFQRFCCNFLSFTTTHSALRIVFQYTYRGATFSLRFISDFLLFSFCFLQVPEGSRRFILIPAHWGGSVRFLFEPFFVAVFVSTLSEFGSLRLSFRQNTFWFMDKIFSGKKSRANFRFSNSA